MKYFHALRFIGVSLEFPERTKTRGRGAEWASSGARRPGRDRTGVVCPCPIRLALPLTATREVAMTTAAGGTISGRLLGRRTDLVFISYAREDVAQHQGLKTRDQLA